MTTESGLKLRTKLESAKTLTFTNAATGSTHSAGDMTVIGSTIGVVVENVGTSGQSPDDTYPNGPDGVLVYEAEKIVLPKTTTADDAFSVGARGRRHFRHRSARRPHGACVNVTPPSRRPQSRRGRRRYASFTEERQ